VHAIARGILSVCPSVTFRYCVQTNEDRLVRFSASGRTNLVSGEVKFIRIFTPSEGLKVKHPSIDGVIFGLSRLSKPKKFRAEPKMLD